MTFNDTRTTQRAPGGRTRHCVAGYSPVICALKFALTGLILALTGACSPTPVWTPDEIQNSKHFFRSLEASQRAAELTRKNDPDVPQFGVEEVNKYQMDALREARLVEDAVLDKAHSGLKEHFRLEYQKGLDSILASYRVANSSASDPPSGDQVDLQVAGVRLLKQWSDWMSAHHSEIRMPDQLVAKSK